MKKVKRRVTEMKPARSLLAFAKPMLDDVTDVKNVELTRKVLKVAVALWNATTLDERGEPGAMDGMNDVIATMPEHLQKISRRMIAARRESFSRAPYLLRDLEIVEDEHGKMQVQVVADPG